MEDNDLKLDKKKSMLMWTILIIALVQMPGLALTPAINVMQTVAFPDHSLPEVQTALALTNLISPLMSIIAAVFINKRIFTKKGIVITGLVLLSLTGLLAVFFHTEFWHIRLLSVILGMATGLFMTNAFGLMFDNFADKERERIAGYQTSSINAGGIIMSLAGGVLASTMWYGGYLILLIGLPIAVLAYFTVPHYKSPTVENKGAAAEKKKLNPRVFYYAALACIFMMIYGVCGANISTHIAKIGNATTSGIAMALQMGGGVVSGIFFGKLSERFKDYIMVIACVSVFIGFMIIALFASSLMMIFIGIFITGLSLSMMLPRCIFSVSTLVDSSSSATATVIASSVAPSLGGFLSPVIFTNLTMALGSNSTIFRYIFVACCALVFGVIIAFITLKRTRKGTITA